MLWNCVSSCVEIVLHSLFFTQADHEVEKEVVNEVEKKFELSLATFLDSIERIHDLLIEGKENNVVKEGKEGESSTSFDRYLYLDSPSSSSKVVNEVEKGSLQIILSPQWLKLVSLTVRTVLSWCTLLLLTECENESALSPSLSPSPPPPLSLPLSLPLSTPSSSLSTAAATVPLDAACTPSSAPSSAPPPVLVSPPVSISVPVTVAMTVPACVKDGMWRARQLLIQLIGLYRTVPYFNSILHVYVQVCLPTCPLTHSLTHSRIVNPPSSLYFFLPPFLRTFYTSHLYFPLIFPHSYTLTLPSFILLPFSPSFLHAYLPPLLLINLTIPLPSYPLILPITLSHPFTSP